MNEMDHKFNKIVLIFYLSIESLDFQKCYPVAFSRGTKVEKKLTLAPERYTAGFCMAAKVILWCI